MLIEISGVTLTPSRLAIREIRFSMLPVISGVELAPARFAKSALDRETKTSGVELWVINDANRDRLMV